MRQDRPSPTAQLIALSVVALGRDRRLAPLMPAGAAWLSERFLGAVAPYKVRAVTLPAVRWLGRVVERLLLPGIQAHYAVCKRYIEGVVRQFVERGVAGSAWSCLVPGSTRRRTSISARSTSTIQARWPGMGDRPVFVAEGLTMYLRPSAVAALLRSCAETGGPGSAVVFTFVTLDARGRPRSKTSDRSGRARSVPGCVA